MDRVQRRDHHAVHHLARGGNVQHPGAGRRRVTGRVCAAERKHLIPDWLRADVEVEPGQRHMAAVRHPHGHPGGPGGNPDHFSGRCDLHRECAGHQ